MGWIKKNDYYMQNGNWTICKTGRSEVRYGLWNGNEKRGYVNHGWFDTSKQAMDKWKELTA
jgi:hypothetical protein